MLERIHAWIKNASFAKRFYILWALVVAVFLLATPSAGERSLLLLMAGVITLLFVCRPGSLLHRATVERVTLRKTICTVLAAIATIAVCVLPMGQLSIWNGEMPDHRNQYELLTESFLDGHLYIEYGDEAELAKLENPYDPQARKEAGVSFHWDHAYYDGHYYMYFGVVPVFLAFLPYRVITGSPLTTYHATQFFVALAIAGIFALFHLLAKRFFPKLSYSVYLSLSVAFSVMSVWYSAAEPALYCTAITAAIALEVWSLFFFVKAVWGSGSENKQIALAAVGALLGALVFGCRPPIALANLLVIPLLVVFIRQRKFTAALCGKLVLAALPYVLVAAGLMLYNFVRFDDPFEFGQTYQLTVADQSQYGVSLDADSLLRLVNETVKNFFGYSDLSAVFPFLSYGGVFFNFPILLLSAGLIGSHARKSLRRQNLTPFVIGLVLTALIITVVDILWTPYLLERYRMDLYFLVAILCYISIGLWHGTRAPKQRPRVSCAVVICAMLTVVSSFLFCVKTMGAYYPETIETVKQALLFWRHL